MQHLYFTLLIFLYIFPATAAPSINLGLYKKSGPSFTLPKSGGNLSDITFNWDTNTYFVIQNKYAHIFEYDITLKKLLRKFHLSGHKDSDYEGIVYLGKDQFAVSNESNHVLIITINAKSKGTISTDPNRAEVQEFKLPRPGKGNKGLEGVCFTRRGEQEGTFFATQEDRDKKVYTWTRPSHKKNMSSRWGAENKLKVTEPFNAETIFKHQAKDLSGCYYNDQTNSLLIVSHESSRLIEVTVKGKILSTLNLTGAPQFEGVTINDDGDLILISEPNLIQIYKGVRPYPLAHPDKK